MYKKESYRVVIREKTTLAIIEESKVIDCPDAWISAFITSDSMWEKFSHGNKEIDFYMEILEVE